MTECDGSLSRGQCSAFASEFDAASDTANARSDVYTGMRAKDFRSLMALCCAGSRAPCCQMGRHLECPIGRALHVGGPTDVCHRQSEAPPSAATLVAQTWPHVDTTTPASTSVDWDPRPWAPLVMPVLMFMLVLLKLRAQRRELNKDNTQHGRLVRSLEAVERF